VCAVRRNRMGMALHYMRLALCQYPNYRADLRICR
jgi:hypothetical protein